MSTYEILLRKHLLRYLIPKRDMNRIENLLIHKYKDDIVSLSNAVRLGKDNLGIEDSSQSLFIWLMLEETSEDMISSRVGSSLLDKVKNEVYEVYIGTLEGIYKS